MLRRIQLMVLMCAMRIHFTYARGPFPTRRLFQESETEAIVSAISNNTEIISLPRGFKPQPPPGNPLLYPFVTEQYSAPMIDNRSPSSGWRPITSEMPFPSSPASSLLAAFLSPPPPPPLTTSATVKSTTFIPLAKNHAAVDMTTQRQRQRQDSQQDSKESIVYGTWSSKSPLSLKRGIPKSQDLTISAERELPPPDENVLEILGKLTMPQDENSDRETDGMKLSHRKNGRRKIASGIIRKTNTNSLEIISVNASDPKLAEITHEINESIGHSAMDDRINETSLSPSIPSIVEHNSPNPISREWPVDFIDSNEDHINRYALQRSEAEINFPIDRSIEAQLTTTAAITTTTTTTTTTQNPPTKPLHQSAYNITKVGVPYEDQSSNEDPRICVPLTVSEKSLSNALGTMEIERVYCFPLPHIPQSKAEIENENNDRSSGIGETVELDRTAHLEVISSTDEEMTMSSSNSVQLALMCNFVVGFLLQNFVIT